MDNNGWIEIYRAMAKGKSNTDKSDNLVWHVTQVSHAWKIFINLHVPWFYMGFEAI